MLRKERPPKGRTTNARPVPGLWSFLFLILLLALAVASAACSKSANVNSVHHRIDSSGPPFTAKEPPQYRATRSTTTTGADGGAATSEQVGIARDGARWRQDFTVKGEPITLLDLPEGRVLIARQRTVFARLRPDEPSGSPSVTDDSLAPDLSPERLLNQDDWRPEYAKLRADQFNGRAVTIYQVTLRSGADATESQIWIDDETGFPLKTEATATIGGVRQPPGYVTEIRDLVLGPPPAGWFDVPPAYREIGVAEFWQASR